MSYQDRTHQGPDATPHVSGTGCEDDNAFHGEVFALPDDGGCMDHIAKFKHFLHGTCKITALVIHWQRPEHSLSPLLVASWNYRSGRGASLRYTFPPLLSSFTAWQREWWAYRQVIAEIMRERLPCGWCHGGRMGNFGARVSMPQALIYGPDIRVTHNYTSTMDCYRCFGEGIDPAFVQMIAEGGDVIPLLAPKPDYSSELAVTKERAPKYSGAKYTTL